MTVSGRFSGDVALVTGAGGEIGQEIALRLSSEGAAVGIFDLDRDKATVTRDAVIESGGRAIVLAADVSDRDQVRDAVAELDAQLGPVTVAVNNAAIAPTASFLETQDSLWSDTLAVNLTGPFLVGQEVARRMVQGGGGRIVNISSTAAHRAHENLAAYAASKAGLEALTRQMAFELGPHGVRVNSVCLGPIMTELNRAVLNDAARAARIKRMPAGRLGQPTDIASVVAFLVSDDAAFLYGATLPAEGGFLIAGVRANPE